MDRICHAPPSGLFDIVAGLVRDLRHAHSTTAEGEHFGLKGKFFDPRVSVECGKDLFLGTHDDPVAGAQIETGLDTWEFVAHRLRSPDNSRTSGRQQGVAPGESIPYTLHQ